MQSTQLKLFVGLEVTSRLKDHLENIKKAEELYLQPGSGFLEPLSIDGQQWLGKLVDNPFSAQDFDNIYKNVHSLIKRVVPNFRLQQDMIKVVALRGEGALEGPNHDAPQAF